MSKDNRPHSRTRFDALAQPAAGDVPAFWYASDLLKALGDSGHVAFIRHARRAAAACKAAGNPVSAHCRGVMRTPAGRKGAGQPERDFELSRYACLLVATTIDSRRAAVLVAREYFGEPTTRKNPIEAPPGDNPTENAIPDRAPDTTIVAPPVEIVSPPSPVARKSSDATPTKNPWAEALAKTRGNPGSEGRFIPGQGGNFQGNRNQSRNASWNPNLAVGRGHPNGAARNSR